MTLSSPWLLKLNNDKLKLETMKKSSNMNDIDSLHVTDEHTCICVSSLFVTYCI